MAAGAWRRRGRGLVFASSLTSFDLVSLPSDESNTTPTLLHEEGYEQIPSDLSPDGAWLVYTTNSALTGLDINLLPLDDTRIAENWLVTPANETEAAISPDGRYIAYTSDDSGTPQIYVRTFSGEGSLRFPPLVGARRAGPPAAPSCSIYASATACSAKRP